MTDGTGRWILRRALTDDEIPSVVFPAMMREAMNLAALLFSDGREYSVRVAYYTYGGGAAVLALDVLLIHPEDAKPGDVVVWWADVGTGYRALTDEGNPTTKMDYYGWERIA